MTADTNQDLTFPHYYEVEELRELPSDANGERRLYYPGASKEGGHDGLLIRVSPFVGAAWIGVFAFGDHGSSAVSGIYSCPDGDSLCVVSGGQGYVVKASDPQHWEELEIYPILDVRPIRSKRILLFHDFIAMSAYGPGGLAWTSSRISSDGLRITEATARYVKGLAWDAATQREVEFFVDLETGHHEGGSSSV